MKDWTSTIRSQIPQRIDRRLHLKIQSEISQNDDLSLDFATEGFGVKETSDSPNANTKKKAPQ